MSVPFGEWLPDLPVLSNPGATVATNVIPRATSYGPFSDLVAYSNALSARCQGAISCRSKAGTIFTFAGTATGLFKLNGTSWEDVSRTSGGAYNCPADGFWSFAQFGNLVIATNGADAPQSFNMASSTDFAALAGSPPVAKFVMVVGEFVVLLNIQDNPQRAQWCARDDATDWTASAATQSDSQDTLGDHGDIMGGVGGTVGFIFFERAIVRMEYQGSPLIFRFDRIEQARGCAASGSIVPLGPAAFYLSDDGFYLFDGQQSVPLGKHKVDKTFYGEVSQDHIPRINGAADPVNALVMWAYPGPNSSAGDPNRVLLFNWKTGRWAKAEIAVEYFWRDLSKGTTLDGLDAVSATLEALPFSLDARIWAGGKTLLAAFDSAHKLGFFTGSALAATLETGEAQLFPGQRALAHAIWPMVDGGTLTASLGYRDRPNDSVTWESAVAQNTTGFCPFMRSARLLRARVTVAAGGTWEHAQGVNIEADPDGYM